MLLYPQLLSSAKKLTMKFTLSIFVFAFVLFSCKKSDNSTQTPLNNGPIGGVYSFTALTTKTYDTIPGSGILTTTEYTTTTTNHSGTLTITSNNMNSKGLMYNFSRSGTRKETNTSTGAVINSNISPFTGSSGVSTSNYSSSYTIDANALTLTIDNAQYLFNPAFITQPSDKKYTYALTGNTLKITTNTYSASNRNRTVDEATFTKQ